MDTAERGQGAATRGFAVVALAIAGLLFAFTPLAERADLVLLDAQWQALRRFDLRPAPDDIVVVGVDEATVARIAEPRGLWHEALGKGLARIAAARPRAIGLDMTLPDRSYESTRPGLDHALLLGLAAARQNGPFVATLSIDAHTRGARPIHPPFLAMLQEERLGIGLLARDADGVTRRFSLALPTEDGSFPTFTGRLCKAMSRPCSDGLLHYALGAPFRYVPLQDVLAAPGVEPLERAFKDRIVLVGETLPFTDRVAVPVDYAGWEPPGREAPAIVVQALALRTALLDAAPQEASRPMAVLLVGLAALIFLLRDPRAAAAAAFAAAGVLFGLGVLALRSGTALPLAAPYFTLALASLVGLALALSRRYVIRRR